MIWSPKNRAHELAFAPGFFPSPSMKTVIAQQNCAFYCIHRSATTSEDGAEEDTYFWPLAPFRRRGREAARPSRSILVLKLQQDLAVPRDSDLKGILPLYQQSRARFQCPGVCPVD